jgi:TRAP-type C4-dicarboxylate transport system substrate-binding protein
MTLHRKKRSLSGAAFALSLSVVMALAGCGGDDEGGSGGGSDKNVSLVYSSIVPESTALSQSFKAWADEVTDKTGVKFDGYYSGALLAAGDELSGLQEGRADMAYLADPYYPTQFPLWNVVGVPFVTSNVEAQVRTLTELYESDDNFRSEFDKNGVHVLFFLPVASTTLASSKSIDSLEDLKGLRVRSVGLMGDALSAAGADVVSMAATETYESLQRGTIDANSATTLDVLVGQKLQEVAKNVVQTGLGDYASAAVVISKDKWDSLRAETQEAMSEAASVAVDTSFKLLTEAEDAACDEITSAGGQVTLLPEDEVSAWKSMVGDSVVEAWRTAATKAGVAEEAANDFYDKYISTLDKLDSESEYQDGMARCANAS